MSRRARSIKFEMVICCGVFLLLLFATGGSGVFGLSRLGSILKESNSGGMASFQDLLEIRTAQIDVWLQLRRIELAQNSEEAATSIGTIHSDEERLEKAWKSFSGRMSGDSDRKIATVTGEYVTEFERLIRQIENALASSDVRSARSMEKALEIMTKKLNQSLDAGVEAAASQAKMSVADGESTCGLVRRAICILLFVSVLIGAVITRYMMKNILGPLGTAVVVADEIAEGKLGNSIPAASRNELGHLLESLRKMDCHLSEIAREIQGASVLVEGTSREIAAGNIDLSARTEEQVASLEETAANMMQLTETVRHNADNARHASGLAAQATSLADTGNEAVREMVATIERISAGSGKISEITSTIEGIAFQTNILALNAAVEAARAGQLGRGFSVVAAKVRSLAQHASAAAKEINDLIGASVTLIRTSDKQAVEVGEIMSDVKRAIKQVSDIVGEIAVASDEQSHGIEQIGQAVVQMDHVTQQNAVLVQQASAAAHSLEGQARNLDRAASVFQVS
ncbi:methyl-accepting chemotaxis protein [Paraburkholderia youngii]|uniref:methyl-accepting chemotaxis protein n=1 Tax=Paraburkholderia youngii TaxID=2782701 RepID=UPI003D1E5FCA